MKTTSAKRLIHGGQLQQIAQQYNIAIEDWLDLSTGIAPFSYPIPNIPEHIWRRLPEPSSELLVAAKQYYQCQHILPISGSQAVIQLLPKLLQNQDRKISKVFLPQVGYQEHHRAWFNSPAQLYNYQNIDQLKTFNHSDVVVVINPNNPTGQRIEQKQLAVLFEKVKQADAMLIIDEAFMDASPEYSFIGQSHQPNLIVLRSLGKFFGLAGLRLGFVAAAPYWLQQITDLLGPWSVNGPAQYIAQQALNDRQWQQHQRARLTNLSIRLAGLLQTHFKGISTGTALFQTIPLPNAERVFEQLCEQGIYVRLCDEKNAIRLGIPTESQFTRLEKALKSGARLL